MSEPTAKHVAATQWVVRGADGKWLFLTFAATEEASQILAEVQLSRWWDDLTASGFDCVNVYMEVVKR